MKNLVGLSIKAAVTMALVACAGQSSDPLQDYKDIPTPVAKHGKKTEVQEIEIPRFAIAVKGTTEKSYGNFVLNKRGNVQINLVSLDGTAIQDASLKVLEFAGSNQPQVSKSDANTFNISWTPKSDALDRTDFQIAVSAKVFGKLTEQTKDLVFTVSKDEKQPTVEEVTGLGVKNAQEGKDIKFSVVVKDPNFDGVGRPEVIFPVVSYDNTENFTASAHRYVDLEKVASQGAGVFRFFYNLDLSKLPKDIDRKGKVDENASKVTLCLNIRVVSVSDRASGTQQECLEAKYTAQPAKIELLSANRKVKGDQSNSIDVRISNDSGSTVNLLNAEKQIANLSGTKSITCQGLGEKSANCTISWTPSCDVKANTQKSSLLNLKVISSMNDSNKESNLSAQFSVDCSKEAAKLELAKQEIKAEVLKVEAPKQKIQTIKPKLNLETPAVAAASGDKS